MATGLDTNRNLLSQRNDRVLAEIDDIISIKSQPFIRDDVSSYHGGDLPRALSNLNVHSPKFTPEPRITVTATNTKHRQLQF